MMQTYGSTEGYNSRRKRQLDLSGVRNKKVEDVTDIHWSNEKKLAPEAEEIESGWEEVEVNLDPSTALEQQAREPLHVPLPSADAKDTMSLDGKPIRFQSVKKEKPFEKTHVRFTSYLEHDLYLVVQALKKQGHIRSITDLVNESIKHYLTCTEA
jgi:hypothetical protein